MILHGLNLDLMKSAYNLAIDKSNNIYVATNTTAHLPVTESNGENDIIIMKYNSNGDVLWIKQYGTEKHDSVNEIIIKNDEIYITGYVNGEFTEFDRYGKGNIFIMKLDSNGEETCIKTWSKINSSMNTLIDSSILLSISFNSDNVLYGLGLKDDFYANDYNPLLLEFDF